MSYVSIWHEWREMLTLTKAFLWFPQTGAAEGGTDRAGPRGGARSARSPQGEEGRLLQLPEGHRHLWSVTVPDLADNMKTFCLSRHFNVLRVLAR